MEKRTFLAIILSIFVLIAYQNLVMPRNENNKTQNVIFSQTIVNKEVKSDENDNIKASLPSPDSFKKTDLKETTEILENKNISVEFSNIGGKIRQVNIKGKESLPLKNISLIDEYQNVDFDLIVNEKNKISYKYTSGEYEIVKTYILSKQEYILEEEVLIRNISKMSNVKDIKINIFSIDSQLIKNRKDSENGLYEYSAASGEKVFRKSNAYKFSKNDNKSDADPARWIGFRDKFYCAVFKPEFENTGYQFEYINDNEINLSIKPKALARNPEEAISLKAMYYFGPQDQDILKSIGLGDFVVFSQYWLLDIVSKTVIKIVKIMHKFIPSLGFCLILVSILIYGVMYPLTMSGMLSMRKMQALQPKMAKLKEQYKNNPQKLNQEVMNLYKENSINPLGGCLPFILQMPIFIGLYQALWRSVVFQGQGFLWIKDLSMPDRLFILPYNLFLIGNEINILPLIMTVAMFFQQKLSTKNMVLTDQNQIMQQKMMSYFFPVFLGILFYKFASGLNLYFTVFYILSIFTQLKMSKMTSSENA